MQLHRYSSRILYVTERLRKNLYVGTEIVTAVKNASITIEKGEFVCIVGHSGSGKSTLLTLLGGLDTPTSGKLFFMGQDMRELNEDDRAILRRENIGYVFQFFNLVDTLTAYENVALPLRLLRKSESEIDARVKQLLNDVGLLHRADHCPPTMSGGEQQRVAIARALANSPQVVLADEPTGNLDSQTSQEVVALMRRLNKEYGQTFVIVTHDLGMAEFADRVFEMKDGVIQQVS